MRSVVVFGSMMSGEGFSPYVTRCGGEGAAGNGMSCWHVFIAICIICIYIYIFIYLFE